MTTRTRVALIPIALLGAAFLGGIAGAALQETVFDQPRIAQAERNEQQAGGLEDECKAQLAKEVQAVIDEDKDTGDYRLSVYGGRRLVCEEKDVRIVRQPDAEEPLVVGCQH